MKTGSPLLNWSDGWEWMNTRLNDGLFLKSLPTLPEAEKKFRHGGIGGPKQPGGGANSRRQKRRWFLRSRGGTELTGAEGRIHWFL